MSSRAPQSKLSPFDQLEAAFAADPETNAAAYAHALGKAGRSKEAVVALQRLHARAPLKGAARRALAQALFDVFRIDDAAELLRDMPSAWSQDPAAQRLLAEIAIEREQHDAARNYAKRSYELDPKSGRTRELLVFLGEIPPSELTSEAMTNEQSLVEPEELAPPPPQASLKAPIRFAVALALVLAGIVAVCAWRVRVQAEVTAICAQGKALKNKGDWHALEKADKIYRAALGKDSKSPVALGAMLEIHALLYFEHGIDSSKGELAEWLMRARDANARTGDRFLGEGLSIIIAGDPPRAEKVLRQILEDGGFDARVLFALGIAQRTQGKYTQARDTLRRAYELDPFQPTFALELGDTFLLDSDTKNAEYFWRKAADANADHGRAVSRAVIGKLLLGDDPESVQALVEQWQKREVPPAHRSAVLAMQARFAQAQGKAQDAQRLIREAKSLRPYDPAIDWLMARILADAGNKDALPFEDGLLRRFPGLQRLPVDAAYVAAKLGRPDDGCRRLEQMKDLTPARIDALCADIMYRGGDTTAALARADKALKADPQSAEAHYVIGRNLQLKNEPQKALEHYSKALANRAVYPEVYQQVGLVYADNKEHEQALVNLLQAEKQYLQTGAAPAQLAKLYDDLARVTEQRGGKDSRATADKYRQKARRH